MTFSYTVAAGQNTSKLAATAVNLNGSTIKDGAGNAASLSLSGLTQNGPQINTSVVASAGFADGSAQAPAGTPQLANVLNGYAARPAWQVAGVDYAVGVPTGTVLKNPTVAANLPAGVSIDAANHQIDITGANVTLNGFDFSVGGGWGVYVASSATGTITIENSSFVTGANKQSTAITSASGVNANLVVEDNSFNGSKANIPSVAPPPAGTGIGAAINWFGSGSVTIEYNNIYNQPADGVDLSSGTITPTIMYNVFNGLGYTQGSHPDPVQFVADKVNNAVIAFNTIYSPQDLSSYNSGLNEGLAIESQAGATITNTAIKNNVVIATGPKLTQSLNIGVFQDPSNTMQGVVVSNNYLDPTGAYDAFGSGGSAPSGSNLTFTNNVNMVTGGQTAPGSGTFNKSDVSSVTASPGSGTATVGATISFTVKLDEIVTVSGAPTLSLNDGGVATYAGGSGTNTLTFTSTVAAGATSVSALAITGVNLPSGATIKDGFGNAANLAGALVSFSGLGVSGAATSAAITGVAESPSTGDLHAGQTVTFTLTANSALTVAGGTPTLTLNDGGVATYTGGSGKTALQFSYTVAAGQNTSKLAATAVNLEWRDDQGRRWEDGEPVIERPDPKRSADRHHRADAQGCR